MLNINKKFDQIRANKGGDVIVLDGGLATQLESVHNANIKHNRKLITLCCHIIPSL